MSNAVQRILAALREHGHDPRNSGEGWASRCPAHDDRTPSLSIGMGDDGRALVTCHAGCTVDAVCAAMGLRTSDLFEPNTGQRDERTPRTKAKPERTARASGGASCAFPSARDAVDELERRHGPRSATWTYHNAGGEPVGLVIRWNTSTGKDVRPVSRKVGGADGSGWIIGGMPTPRPLYALPDLLATKPGGRVYVCEGEKAAEAARAVGLVATTSPHGSKSAAKADWSPLAGRDVVILPDHDDAGERYAQDVARLASAAGAKSVRVVRLAELWAGMPVPPGGDLADLVEHCRGGGGDVDALRAQVEALVDKAQATIPEPTMVHGVPIIVRVCDVKPEAVDWLWPDRIALGKLTLIAGDPGLGKSFLTLDMAARVSTGVAWPDAPGVPTKPGGVVLLSAEDCIADTIRPRLDAAGADTTRIAVLEAMQSVGSDGRQSVRMFDLSRDLPALESAIAQVEGCRMVVIDPLTAYLGGVDSHKNADIRGLLAPLAALAQKHRVAVVAVTHLNKSGGGPAIYRAMGSLAFAAAARGVWAVSKDKDDPQRRLFVPIKNNIAPDTGGLAYRITAQAGGGCPVVAWEPGAVNVSADDALAGDPEESGGRTERKDAAAWLTDFLANGPRHARDVLAESKAAGFSKRTIDRAKADAGVRTRKEAFGGGWVWELSGRSQGCHTVIEGCYTPEVGNLGEKEHENNGFDAKDANGRGVATLGNLRSRKEEYEP